jgi:hypothetical protein
MARDKAETSCAARGLQAMPRIVASLRAGPIDEVFDG